MLKTLLRVEFQGLISALTTAKDKKKAKPMTVGKVALFIFLFILLIASCMFSFVGLFLLLSTGLKGTGYEWLFMSVMAILAFLLDFITTIFFAKSKLFEAKDNELLLSMPIRPKDILVSRMLFILISNYFFELVIAIPGYVIWCIQGQVTFVGTLLLLVALVTLPLFAMSLASLVGWLFSLLAKRMRRKNLFAMLLAIIFVALYLVTVPFIQEYMKLLITQAPKVADALQKYITIFYWFGHGIALKNVGEIALFAICMVAPFLVTCYILSATFLNFTTKNREARGVVRAMKAQKASKVGVSLFRKDMRLLTSSVPYMLNAGLSVLLLLGIAVGAFFMPMDELAMFLGGLERQLMPAIMIALLCLMSGMIMFSAPSLNIEGQNIYVLQALPIRGRAILLSKVCMHLAVACPVVLVASICCLIATPTTVYMGVLLILIPQIFNVFIAISGITMNLLFPRFDYASDVAAVKQSMAGLMSMLVGSFSGIAFAVGGYFLIKVISIPLTVSLIALVPLGISVALFLYIWKCGDKVFAKL